MEIVSNSELLKLDGAIVADGTLGGSRGAVFFAASMNQPCADNICFCDDIANNITKTRFMEVEMAHKLCDNEAVPKKGEDGHNPSHKCDCIFKMPVHNASATTEGAPLDLGPMKRCIHTWALVLEMEAVTLRGKGRR